MLNLRLWDSKAIAILRKPAPELCTRLVIQQLETRILLSLNFDTAFTYVKPPIQQWVDGHVFVGVPSGEAEAMALEPVTNKVYLSGWATASATTRNWEVARLLATTGAPDPLFGGGDGIFNEAFHAGTVGAPFDLDAITGIAIDEQGRIVVCGYAKPSSTGAFEFAVARLLNDGTLDDDFNMDGKHNFPFPSQTGTGQAQAVTIDPQGRIIVVGHIEVGSETHLAAARFDAFGNPDDSFGKDGMRTFTVAHVTVARSVIAYGDLAADRRILIGGHVNHSIIEFDQILDFAAFRLVEDGGFDMAFGVGGKRVIDIAELAGEGVDADDTSWDMTRQPSDGKFVMIGHTDTNGPSKFLMARFKPNADGADKGLDLTFHTDGIVVRQYTDTTVMPPIRFKINQGRAVARRTNGEYLLSGFTTNEDGLPGHADMYVGRFDQTGNFIDEIRSTFPNTEGNADQAWGVAEDSQSRIVAGGFHTHQFLTGITPGVAAIRLIVGLAGMPSPPRAPAASAPSAFSATGKAPMTHQSAPDGSAPSQAAGNPPVLPLLAGSRWSDSRAVRYTDPIMLARDVVTDEYFVLHGLDAPTGLGGLLSWHTV